MTKQTWLNAQQAEKQYNDGFPKRIETPKPNIFINKRFKLPLKFFDNKNILEIGSSIYSHIHSLNGKPSLTVGLDPLASYLSNNYPKTAEHIEARGEELPFKKSAFDSILCINTLDHTESPTQVLEEIKESLSPNGVLLFSINTYELPHIIRQQVISRFDPPHPHHFARKEIIQLLNQSGFKIQYSYYEKQWLNEFKKDLAERKLYKSALKFFAAHLIFRLQNMWVKCTLA